MWLRHSWRGCGAGHDLRRPRRAGRLLQAGRALDVAGVTVEGVTVAIGSRHPIHLSFIVRTVAYARMLIDDNAGGVTVEGLDGRGGGRYQWG